MRTTVDRIAPSRKPSSDLSWYASKCRLVAARTCRTTRCNTAQHVATRHNTTQRVATPQVEAALTAHIAEIVSLPAKVQSVPRHEMDLRGVAARSNAAQPTVYRVLQHATRFTLRLACNTHRATQNATPFDVQRCLKRRVARAEDVDRLHSESAYCDRLCCNLWHCVATCCTVLQHNTHSPRRFDPSACECGPLLRPFSQSNAGAGRCSSVGIAAESFRQLHAVVRTV